MEPRRADPDELLRGVTKSEARSQTGRLKVFFGAAPGVGKTYAMLEGARRESESGRDVVVGFVETHGRSETGALLVGLEALERKVVDYRGKELEEFDLDAALARRPSLILVDELAHTNAPGVRHPKRWQDVLELLDAGIEVWTTLNVQHVESLNDVVAQVTGVRVRETLPDAVLERATEVELVDLAPEALIDRLREGKVYPPDQAKRAELAFFRKGNLLALRELVLRRTAEHVDTDVQAYRREHGIATTWPVAEHILVCIGPSPASADLVRAARRMAAGLRAQWTAASVESPSRALSEEDRARLTRHQRLAEQLGAKVTTLSGLHPAEEILAFARSRNVTRIIMGKPTHPRWRDVVFGSMLEDVVRGSGDIDVHVIRGDATEPPVPGSARRRATRIDWSAYASSSAVVALATLVSWALLHRAELANLVMVYLLGIVFVSYRFGRGPSLFASVLSVAIFDFCFVPPYFTFAVADMKYLLTFAVLLMVGLVVSGLTERVRQQAEAARSREARTSALYGLARELASSVDEMAIVDVARRHVEAALDGKASLLVEDSSRRLAVLKGMSAGFEIDERERSVAAWAFEHGREAGLSTTTLPGARALYLPLHSPAETVGVLAILPSDPKVLDDPEQRQLLEAFGHQTAMALERVHLAERAKAAHVRAEREELYSSLLSSVSHDLRTPLAAITGAASALLEGESVLVEVRRDLLQTIFEEADRLNRLVGNLLDMTRLESGDIQLRRDWIPLEEIVGTVLSRLDPMLQGRQVDVRLDPDLPLVSVDALLMGQVFVNLLENAVKYTPVSSSIDITARAEQSGVIIEVADRGPGLPAGAEARLFDKFFRAGAGGQPTGTGLGLAIVRGVVVAHGGMVVAENRSGGGAVFRITLPIEGAPPSVPSEELPSTEDRETQTAVEARKRATKAS